MPKRFYLNVTVNTPTEEYDLNIETDSIDEVVGPMLECSPDCTSMVIALLVNREGERE